MPPTADIALLTESRYVSPEADEGDWYHANILRDDELLQDALSERGLSSVRVDWANPEIDWEAFDCAVFRTTWDYHEKMPAFTSWLKSLHNEIRICNPLELIWWNLDKHYLADLADAGIPIVPTHFIEKDAPLDLPRIISDNGWNEVVVKPCVSAGARHTYRIMADKAATVQKELRPLLSEEAFMVQPFLEEIVATGEDTLMVIDGEVTHAVRKVAKPGDFRVQDDHGGTVHTHEPTEAQVELALQAISACNPTPSYGRVDMVQDSEDQWRIMELELIEPEIWIRYHPPSAKTFASAIEKYLVQPVS